MSLACSTSTDIARMYELHQYKYVFAQNVNSTYGNLKLVHFTTVASVLFGKYDEWGYRNFIEMLHHFRFTGLFFWKPGETIYL